MTPELTQRITFHLKWYFETRLKPGHELLSKVVSKELRNILTSEASLDASIVDELINRFRAIVASNGTESINEKEVTKAFVLRQQS